LKCDPDAEQEPGDSGRQYASTESPYPLVREPIGDVCFRVGVRNDLHRLGVLLQRSNHFVEEFAPIRQVLTDHFLASRAHSGPLRSDIKGQGDCLRRHRRKVAGRDENGCDEVRERD